MQVEEKKNGRLIGDVYGGLLAKANSIEVDGLSLEQFRPSGGFLLVRVTKPSSKTKGGLVLPERAVVPSKVGVVMVAGEQSGFIPGETVLFRGGAGCELQFNNEPFLLLESRDDVDTDILGRFVVDNAE